MFGRKNTETEAPAEPEADITLTPEQDELLRAVEKWAKEKPGEDSKLFVEDKFRKNTEILVRAGYLIWDDSKARDHIRLSEASRAAFESLGTIF